MSNYVSGYLLIGMAAGLFFLADPRMIWNRDSLSPSERMSAWDSVGAMAFLSAMATIGVLFVRVRIEVMPDGAVTVVNAIATWRFDISRVVEVVGGPLPSLRLSGGQRVWLMGAENSLAMNLMNRRPRNFEALSRQGASDVGASLPPGRNYRGTLWYVVPWVAGLAISIAVLSMRTV